LAPLSPPSGKANSKKQREAATSIDPMTNERRCRIVVSSHEGLLCGWELSPDTWDGDLMFRFAPMAESLKSLSFSQSGAGNLLVAGGSSENMAVYNVKNKHQVGLLMQHTGAVTCSQFFGGSHMLSGSDDNAVAVWRAKDWACIHLLGGHKGPIHDIAIHPTGKLALSTSRDRTVRMWNLVKGRCAFIRRLDAEATSVAWAPSGSRYLLVLGSAVAVVESAGESEPVTLGHSKRVNAAVFLSDDIVATGGEDRVVHLWRVDGTELLALETGFKTRVKAMEALPVREAQDGEIAAAVLQHLVVCSSDGVVQVWDGVAALDKAFESGSEEEEEDDDLEDSAVEEDSDEGAGEQGRGGGHGGRGKAPPAGLVAELHVGGGPRITALAVSHVFKADEAAAAEAEAAAAAAAAAAAPKKKKKKKRKAELEPLTETSFKVTVEEEEEDGGGGGGAQQQPNKGKKKPKAKKGKSAPAAPEEPPPSSKAGKKKKSKKKQPELMY